MIKPTILSIAIRLESVASDLRRIHQVKDKPKREDLVKAFKELRNIVLWFDQVLN